MPEAHIFENCEVYQAWRTHPVTIGRWRASADDIKAKFSFWALNTTIGFARFGLKSTYLRLGIHDRSGRDFLQRLFENFDRLAHFEHADHVSIVTISMIAQWNAKGKPIVYAVFVHFANIVINPGSAQDGSRDARVDG